MRRNVVIFIIISALVLIYAVHSVWILLSLLVFDGSEDAISRAELPAPKSGAISERPQLIPKIIHQTYVNDSIPEHWIAPQRSCLDLHKDYEYKLWTDKKAREFIAAEYPWFLETFDGYTYPIQRADAIRYFVLHHFGGIYIDLDDGCNRSLDPLLAYPAWVRRTTPTGISNDVMGAVPRHPFFLKAIDSLPNYNRKWVLPYITVMASTGPLFLSIIWRHYVNANPQGAERLRILFPDEYQNHSWSFFTHHLGNSWHNNDVRLIFWMAKHWLMLTVVGFAVGFLVLGCIYTVFVKSRQNSNSPRSRFAYPRMPSYRRANPKDGIPLEDRLEV
ncbi:glycosyltransferase family 32 protein [Sporormia fimetaria CBS 119925]|uniref:Glycosyltransferase family 32 protein n=1 Tax=Sporormia fimetaria CBS 119925 TaxID=1340428 RepID=A0A6A6VB18_9PLEO|nr:glycosyltransferase family 32 protein [Sporormia fimetaria CBS 119925]